MAHSAKRLLARTAILIALLTASVAASGCGAGGHYVGNVAGRHIAQHFAKTPRAKRNVSRAFCLYSVYRAAHDFTHHHLVFGALNSHQAVINCMAGFKR